MVYNNGGSFPTFRIDLLHASSEPIYGVLIPLDINLDIFSGGFCPTVGSLSIDPEFPSIVDELLKRALCVLDGSMSRYYPVFEPQTSVFPFVCHQNIRMVLVFVEGFISIIRGQSHMFIISILNLMKFPLKKNKNKNKNCIYNTHFHH